MSPVLQTPKVRLRLPCPSLWQTRIRRRVKITTSLFSHTHTVNLYLLLIFLLPIQSHSACPLSPLIEHSCDNRKDTPLAGTTLGVCVCVSVCVCLCVCLRNHWKRRSPEVKVTECVKSLCPRVDKTLAEAGYSRITDPL